MAGVLLAQADALHIPLRDKSVQCIVSSPPYWGLRDYKTGHFIGGDPACNHARIHTHLSMDTTSTLRSRATNQNHELEGWRGGRCGRCGAVCEDNQLGLEKLHDCNGAFTSTSCGVCYVCHLRQVAREIWRVLRDDGTFWLVLGDSFSSGGRIGHGTRQGYKQQTNRGMNGTNDPPRAPQPLGLKPKDLVGIPWRVALALQQDGWTLRCDIVWDKPNCMPESVQDRPTHSHEYLFFLTKGQRYYYDGHAIGEEATCSSRPESSRNHPGTKSSHTGNHANGGTLGWNRPVLGRNARSVWTIPTEPFAGAHFATFPTALVERCIRAGTSEAGCCPACGTALVRQVERIKGDVTNYNGSSFEHGKTHDARAPLATVGKYQRTAAVIYHGFTPACHCPTVTPVPCIVCDPFSGSSTTVLVARNLGRNAIGCDLSWDYLHKESRERLGLVALQEWAHGREMQEETFDDLPLFR